LCSDERLLHGFDRFDHKGEKAIERAGLIVPFSTEAVWELMGALCANSVLHHPDLVDALSGLDTSHRLHDLRKKRYKGTHVSVRQMAVPASIALNATSTNGESNRFPVQAHHSLAGRAVNPFSIELPRGVPSSVR
jgi:hypothetical protein